MLGWTQEEIGKMVGLSRNRISKIVGNTDFGKIDTEMQSYLKQGRDKGWLQVLLQDLPDQLAYILVLLQG